jgi:hypothetical protein
MAWLVKNPRFMVKSADLVDKTVISAWLLKIARVKTRL